VTDSWILPNEIFIGIPVPVVGLENPTHQVINLPFDEQIFLPGPWIDRNRRLLLSVKGLELVFA
jgi:hypothetical protein